MAKSRGQDFEDEFRASIPEGVFVKKLHTPAPPPAQIEAVVAHLRRNRAPEWMVGAVSRSSHTPRQGFDMLVAPAVDAEPFRYDTLEPPAAGFEMHRFFGAPLRDTQGASFFLLAKPVLLFCLELKSTQGKSFAFSRLKDHQQAALHKEALAGRIAGVVIEFAEIGADCTACGGPSGGDGYHVIGDADGGRREVRCEQCAGTGHVTGDVLFLPIQSYLAYKRDAGRASLPYDVAERIGMRIEIDAERGRSRRYYKVGEFLRAFGADILEPERREAGRARGTLPANRTGAPLPCMWCGRPFDEHEDNEGPGRPIPKVPCQLLKRFFSPREAAS